MRVGTHGTANRSKGHTVAVESQRHFLTKDFHKRNASDLLFPVVAICWEVLLLQICKIYSCLFLLLVGGQPEGDPVSQCCVAQSLQQGAVSEMGNPKQGGEVPFCPAGSAHH